MAKIGFIGLGHMGQPMVLNLIKAGHEVTVFDIAPAAIQVAVAKGAKAAESVMALATSVDVIITMLQTGEQVSQVCLGANGIFAHLRPGSLYIDSSSIDVVTCRRLHTYAKQQQIEMVDAPVSGGVAGAQAGSLTIMVGGEPQAFVKAEPYLAKLGKTIIHAGRSGNGQVAKICNNMILGISMIAVSEAFNLGEKLGLPAEKLFAISSQASGQCWAMTSYSPVPGLVDNVPSNRNYQPGFTAQMMLKDLGLSQAAANSAKANTPLGAKATELYEQFVIREKQGQVDFSAIIKMLASNSH